MKSSIDIRDALNDFIIDYCYELHGKYINYKKVDDYIYTDSFLVKITDDISVWGDVDIYATFEKDHKDDDSLRISNIYNVEVKGIFLDK